MPTIMQGDDYRALLESKAPIGVVQDFLRDAGEWDAADGLAVRTPWLWMDIWRFMKGGIGSGRGSGIGRGIGSGRGIGRGIGIGSGRGIGSGSGIGSGRGIGRGIGRGSGRGYIYPWSDVMRIGKNYLVHLGDWHTFIGRCTEQTGPLQYAMDCASKVDIQSSGDRWHDLCAGDKKMREAADYKHQPGEIIVPLSIVAIEWFGDLPHPDYKS